jgi:hypothetical protein
MSGIEGTVMDEEQRQELMDEDTKQCLLHSLHEYPEPEVSSEDDDEFKKSILSEVGYLTKRVEKLEKNQKALRLIREALQFHAGCILRALEIGEH